MLYARTTAIIGLILVLLPFLGFPTTWKMIAFVIAGVVLLYLGYKEYRIAERHRLAREERTKTYTESVAEKNHEHPDEAIKI
jgi:membrane protein implicated in regulation of membrane protease activity